MSTTTQPKYTLYSIVAHCDNKDAQDSHSMHVNKTKSDLTILGIPYKEVKMTFKDIRSELEAKTGNKTVTVPTLQVGENEYVTDSFKIAEWLDAHHGGLFGSPDGRSFAKFISVWADGQMGTEIRELFRPLFYNIQDPHSQEYFVRVRNGGDLEGLREQIARFGDKDKVAAMGKRARAALQTIESYLAAQGSKFLLGDKPTHADSILYGWYACSLVNAPIVTRELWDHPDLPRLAQWVRDMKAVTKLEPKFPDPFAKK